MKIFQIGFNKCGTTAIAKYYEARGLRAAHYESGNLAKMIQHNIDTDRHILNNVAQFDVYTDMVYIDDDVHIEAFKHFREIDTQVQDAKFILNVRNKKNWIDSCFRHPRFAERMKSVYGYATDEEVRAHWNNDWDRHIETVRNHFTGCNLLVFDIEKDSMSKIGKFAGIKEIQLPADKVRHNYTPGSLYRWLGRCMPTNVKAVVPNTIKNRLRYALRVRR